MENISTNVVKLDLDIILKNYNKPEFWKQKWTIYKRPQIEIVAYISYIDVIGNKIHMKIESTQTTYKLRGTKKKMDLWGSNNYELITIPINNPEYTKENFSRQILGASLKLIRYIERKLITQYSAYKNAEKNEKDEEELLLSIAEDFLDGVGVTSEGIRSAYINAYVEENQVYDDVRIQILKDYDYKLIGNEYLILISYFNNKEMFDEYKKLCTNIRKNYTYQLWKTGQKLASDEYREEMKDKLAKL